MLETLLMILMPVARGKWVVRNLDGPYVLQLMHSILKALWQH